MLKNVVRKEGLVLVEFADGVKSGYHDVWLRDQCGCSKCRTSSDQKSYFAALHEDDSRVMRAEGGSGLSVTFSDGHRATYGAEWLRQHRYDDDARRGRAAARRPELWTGQDVGIGEFSFEFHDVAQGGEALRGMLKALLARGLVLLRGGPADPDTVSRVAAQMGPRRETMYGAQWDVVSKDRPENVAYTDTELGLHQDILYYELTPGVQLLHCLVNGAAGGEARFADGLRVAEDFRRTHPRDFDVLRRARVSHHKFDETHRLRYCRPVFALDEDPVYAPHDRPIVQLNLSPPFEAPLDLPHADVPHFFRAYANLMRMVEDPRYSVEHAYRPGDVAIFVNRRVLHARRAFSGPRHLQGTYVDLDDVHSTLRLLSLSDPPDLRDIVPRASSLGSL